MMRLINGLLILSCLLLATCNLPDNPGQTKHASNSNTQPKRSAGSEAIGSPPIPWLDAKPAVGRAKDKFSPKNINAASPPMVKDVLVETNDALTKLGKASDVDVVCGGCGEDAQQKTRDALTFLTGVTDRLKDKDNQKLTDLDSALASQIQEDLGKAFQALKDANDSYGAHLKSGSNDNNNPSSDKPNDGGDSSLTD